MGLKKAAKLFATKFACGSSVTKNLQGLDGIVVQGAVSGNIIEVIVLGPNWRPEGRVSSPTTSWRWKRRKPTVVRIPDVDDDSVGSAF